MSTYDVLLSLGCYPHPSLNGKIKKLIKITGDLLNGYFVLFGGASIPLKDEWVLIRYYDTDKRAWLPKTFDVMAILEHLRNL